MRVWVDVHLRACCGKLLLVEVRLEAGFEDVERGGEGGGCHAPDAVV